MSQSEQSDSASSGGGRRPRAATSALLVTSLVIGAALAVAPVFFQMFSRAPDGGDMLDGFRPYMNSETIAGFQADMDDIDAAVGEADQVLTPLVESTLGLSADGITDEYGSYSTFVDEWPDIYADMSDMLTTMDANLDNFAAVDALPPFALFPWFFLIPGVLIVGISTWGLIACRGGGNCRGPRLALGIMGVGLILAPAVFQMFTRAPLGGDMIDDFESLMTEAKIQRIQGYFLVIGAGEGTIRAQMLPALEAAGGTSAADLVEMMPAVATFNSTWPTTSNDMAPMIGAMNDNLDNYLAVAALPPFPLFPWFFVIPGALLIGCALAAGSTDSSADFEHSTNP